VQQRLHCPSCGRNEALVVMGWAFSSFVSNISCLVELADILHFHNYNKHNSHLDVVLKRFCNFHIRKNIGKRLSALFLLSYVRSWGKLLLIVI